MGTKSFIAAAGAGLITAFALPTAYHMRDVDFITDDTYHITEEPDGPHIHVMDTKMEEIADMRLIMNEDGELVGQGIVKGDEFEVVIEDPNEEALFIHDHGAEKLWLGRDVVHVQPGSPPPEDSVDMTQDGPGF